MPAVVFTPEEQAALSGLPWGAQVLYFRLRCAMDFATGTVGVVRGAGISWQMLREALFVEPHQGLKDTGTPHESTVRRLVAWLVKCGLVEERSLGKRLQFFLPMAESDYSVRKKADSKPTGKKAPQDDRQADSDNAMRSKAFADKADRQPDSNPTGEKTAKADTPPVSGKDVLLLHARARFAINETWCPREDEFQTHLRLVGVSRGALSQADHEALLDDFRSYWLARGEERTQDAWERTLALRHKQAITEKAGQHETHRRAGKRKRDFIGEDIEALKRARAEAAGER